MFRITTAQTPATIKTSVDVIDLEENLLIPQTPWPLVQPFPSLVPKPTNKPEMTNIGHGVMIVESKPFLRRNVDIYPPNNRPMTNLNLQKK